MAICRLSLKLKTPGTLQLELGLKAILELGRQDSPRCKGRLGKCLAEHNLLATYPYTYQVPLVMGVTQQLPCATGGDNQS